MGLSNGTGGRKTFLNIKEGKIALRAKDGSIETFTHVSGVLTSITIKEGKFGKELHLGLSDDGEEFLLQMKFDSGYARAFMMAIKNADLRLPMALAPKYEESDGKKKSSLFINQDGKGVKWFWTKEKPGDLPPMTSREWKGKTEWDNTAQMAYLEKMLLEEILPQLPHPAVAGAVANDTAKPQLVKEQTKLEDMPEDDLPF